MDAGTLGSTPKVSNLLPSYISQYFPKQVLDQIMGMSCMPSNGGQIDWSGGSYPTSTDVVKAGMAGHCTLDEAILELQSRLESAASELDVSKLKASIDLLTSKAKHEVTNTMSGCFTYIWGRISSRVASPETARILFDGEVSSKVPANGLTAKIVRPKTMADFFHMLHIFVWVVASVGLAHFTNAMTFVYEAVHTKMRDLKISWQVAHELFLIYLKAIENDQRRLLHLGDVVASGNTDTYVLEARNNAEAFFRTVGGNPSASSPSSVEWNGKFNKSATKLCIAFNRGKPCTHLDADGTCKFSHRCMQWVSDKGKRGQCLGDHPFCKCTYDPAKKLDEPLK